MYPADVRLHVVLDNHSVHTSKRTRKFLEPMPNRFVFVVAPKHTLWLHRIEWLLDKMARSLLRRILR